MASSVLWQNNNPHHPDLWHGGDYTCEPLSLDTTQDYDGALAAWLNAVPSELEPSESCAELVSLSTLDNPSAAAPDEWSSFPVESLACGDQIVDPQQYPSIDARFGGPGDRPRRGKLSTSSWDTDCSQDEGCQRLVCPECNRTFGNLSALDKHAQNTSHKAWRCSEPGCAKNYSRRDTFLRHRTTHRDDTLIYACNFCWRDKKHKAFKRKDHLKDHIRNCHSKNSDSRRLIPSVPIQVRRPY